MWTSTYLLYCERFLTYSFCFFFFLTQYYTFRECLASAFEHKSTSLNIISLGDSQYEREAILTVTQNVGENQVKTKSVKFYERPSMEQLYRQVELVITAFEFICQSMDDLDLQLSICDLTPVTDAPKEDAVVPHVAENAVESKPESQPTIQQQHEHVPQLEHLHVHEHQLVHENQFVHEQHLVLEHDRLQDHVHGSNGHLEDVSSLLITAECVSNATSLQPPIDF